MIQRFLTLAADPNAESDLRREVAVFIKSLRDSAGRSYRGQVARAETCVRADPQKAFTFDGTGLATLAVAGYRWQAGRFETPSLGALRQRLPAGGRSESQARLWVLDGASPATDIGSLQATADVGTVFQVASQFNCLEAPVNSVVEVVDYQWDNTQGPRASFSAFPATLLRHYAAPGAGGERFVQATNARQLDLLADVFEPGRSPVDNGYLMDHGGMGAEALASALETRFDRICVGVHDAVQVVLGHHWDGFVEDSENRLIAQVFTSTVAGGSYPGQMELGAFFHPACRQPLRAAYLGTLLAAVALGRSLVVLTLIGGRVFGNPIDLIWESIRWAFDTVRPLTASPLEVVVNGYNLSSQLARRGGIEPILPAVRQRGGVVLQFNEAGLGEIRR